MKVEIVQTPGAAAPAAPSAQPSARERAIARIMGGQNQSQETPVQNANQVSPEEMGAVQTPESIKESSENPGQVHTDEASQPAEPEATGAQQEEKPPLSAQFAQLARKEKAIRAQATEVKAKEADIANREAALKAREAELSSNSQYISKAKLLEDPIGTMTEMGMTYDQLTQKALNAPDPEQGALMAEIKKLNAKIEALEGETKGTKESIVNRDKEAYQQAVSAIRNDATKLVTTNDEYEAIRESGSVEDVVQLIEKTFHEDGELMSVEEAANLVEQELQEQILRFARLSKIQKKLQAPAAPKPAAQPQAASPAQKQQPVKTLTNAMGAQPKMSARERAILAMQGKLNK